MPLLDFLAPALTTATQAVTAYDQGKRLAADDARAQAIQAAQQKRQETELALKQAIADRQAKSQAIQDQLRIKTLNEPKAPVFGTPEYLSAIKDVKTAEADIGRTHGYHAPPGGASGTPDAKRTAYILRRIPTLMKPQSGEFGISKPGLSLNAAQQQAAQEFEAATGGGVDNDAPPPPDTPPSHAEAPVSEEETRAYADLADLYKKALARGVDPATARAAYDKAVLHTTQRYGRHGAGDLSL